MRELLQLMDTTLTAYVNNASEQTENRRLYPEETAILTEISINILPQIRRAANSETISTETYTQFATRIFNLSQTQRPIPGKYPWSSTTFEDDLVLARNLRPLYRDYQREYLHLRGITNASKAPAPAAAASAAAAGPAEDFETRMAAMETRLRTEANTEREALETRLKADAAKTAQQTQDALDALKAENASKALALVTAENTNRELSRQFGEGQNALQSLMEALARSSIDVNALPGVDKINLIFNIQMPNSAPAAAAAAAASADKPLPAEYACSTDVSQELKTKNPHEYARRTLYLATSDLRFLAVEMLIRYLDYVMLAVYFNELDNPSAAGEKIFVDGSPLSREIQTRLAFYMQGKGLSEQELRTRIEGFREELTGSSLNEINEFVKRLSFYIANEFYKTWDAMQTDVLNPARAIMADGQKHPKLRETLLEMRTLNAHYSDQWTRPLLVASRIAAIQGVTMSDEDKVRRVVGTNLNSLFSDRNAADAYLPKDAEIAAYCNDLKIGTAVPDETRTALYQLRR